MKRQTLITTVLLAALAVNGFGNRAEATTLPREPALPQSEPEFSMPAVKRSIPVASRAELDAAFADIQPGDEIVLSNGVVWGQIVLPDHGGGAGAWAILRGERGFPDAGQRVRPDPELTVLRHGGGGGILRTVNVRGWYVFGLKLEPAGKLHEALAIHDSTDIVIDRVWIQAAGDMDAPYTIRRGVSMNGENLALINSRIEGTIVSGQQSQGVGIWNGGGPFLIENNFIESLNQNILIGGAPADHAGKVPRDGVIRRNHLYKRRAWDHHAGTIITLEWKDGFRWLVEGNLIENTTDGGVAVLIKAPEVAQGSDFSRTSDITFRRNRYIGNIAWGYQIVRGASGPAVGEFERFLAEDEWFDPIADRAIQLQGAPNDIVFRRVTASAAHSSFALFDPPANTEARILIEKYRARAGEYGFWAARFAEAYPDHLIRDYWMYEEPGDDAFRMAGIPESLNHPDQMHRVQCETEIPAEVGADEQTVLAAIADVADPATPQ